MKKVDLDRWQKYFDLRNEGIAVEAAAKKARISASTAYRFERGDQSSGGLEAAAILGYNMVAGNLVSQPLSAEAQQALGFRVFPSSLLWTQVNALAGACRLRGTALH